MKFSGFTYAKHLALANEVTVMTIRLYNNLKPAYHNLLPLSYTVKTGQRQRR
jgi:hypothetical protein